MTSLEAFMARIPTVARLYFGGTPGGRRYKRASTQNGPGEPLVHRSAVEYSASTLLAENAHLRTTGAVDLRPLYEAMLARREFDTTLGHQQLINDAAALIIEGATRAR